MDRRSLATIIAHRTQICRSDCDEIVRACFEVIQERLLAGERITVKGFGSFACKHYNEQTFQNKASGRDYSLPPRRVPAFYPAEAFRKALRRVDGVQVSRLGCVNRRSTLTVDPITRVDVEDVGHVIPAQIEEDT